MINLSSSQCKELVVPLIKLTMGDEVGEKAASAFDCEYKDTETWVWGYFRDDKLIAVGGLGEALSPKKIWLGYFAVHPAYRNQGYGSKVLQFIEQQARDNGYKWILVETYDHPTFEDAIRLYKKHGYKEIGRLADYLDDESDALYLRKFLY